MIRCLGFAVYNRTTFSPGAIGSGKVTKLKAQAVAATHAGNILPRGDRAAV